MWRKTLLAIVIMQTACLVMLYAENSVLRDRVKLYSAKDALRKDYNQLLLNYSQVQEHLHIEYREALYDLLDRLDIQNRKYATVKRAYYYRAKYDG